MKLPHPILILFGAGATRGELAGISNTTPPLDYDFFDVANEIQGHGTEKLTKKVLEEVWKLYNKVSVTSPLVKISENINEVAIGEKVISETSAVKCDEVLNSYGYFQCNDNFTL